MQSRVRLLCFPKMCKPQTASYVYRPNDKQIITEVRCFGHGAADCLGVVSDQIPASFHQCSLSFRRDIW